MTIRPWQDHLPRGEAMTVADLTAEGTLLRAWARQWGEAPGARLWLEAGGPPAAADGAHPAGRWWSAGAFEEATRRRRRTTARRRPGAR